MNGVDVGRAGLSADGVPESRVSTARIEEHFHGLVPFLNARQIARCIAISAWKRSPQGLPGGFAMGS